MSFRKFKLPMSLFSKKTDHGTAPNYFPGIHVLAPNPGTTVLCKATVGNAHCKVRFIVYSLFISSQCTRIGVLDFVATG